MYKKNNKKEEEEEEEEEIVYIHHEDRRKGPKALSIPTLHIRPDLDPMQYLKLNFSIVFKDKRN